jgi:hypothetical protein
VKCAITSSESRGYLTVMYSRFRSSPRTVSLVRTEGDRCARSLLCATATRECATTPVTADVPAGSHLVRSSVGMQITDVGTRSPTQSVIASASATPNVGGS